MKIQCSGCEAVEAKVFCCADEAALCLACDEQIHSANKLVSKHQRVSLSTSSSFPKCDICQETFSYFICLEDRAVLCRKCDVSIHTVNSSVRNHQRFLLGGVRVELESARLQQPFRDKIFVQQQTQIKSSTAEPNSSIQISKNNNKNIDGASTDPARKEVIEAGDEQVPTASPIVTKNTINTTATEDWRFKDILEFIDASPSSIPCSNPEGLSTKVSEAKELGDSEWLNILRSTEEELLNDYSQSQTANDVLWTVPQLLPHCLVTAAPASSSPPPPPTTKTVKPSSNNYNSNNNVVQHISSGTAGGNNDVVANDLQCCYNPMNGKGKTRRHKRKAV